MQLLEVNQITMENRESKREIMHEVRFYACLLLSAILMMISIFTPPQGELHQSVVYMSSIILAIGAVCVGVDIKGILYEVRMMRKQDKEWLDKQIGSGAEDVDKC